MAWDRLVRKKKQRDQTSKMGNTPSLCAAGHSHRSKLESAVCQMLQYREKAGEIRIIQVEDHICICGPEGHECPRRIQYVADFKCLDLTTNQHFWVEAKGFPNDRWPRTKILWRHYGPGKLEIWRGTYGNLLLDEVLQGAA